MAISIYSAEHYYSRTRCNQLRRHTVRLDGFTAIQANTNMGELITKLFTFTGNNLTINLSTSAVGKLGIEIQDANGSSIPNFSFSDCNDIFGDATNHTITWQNNSDLSHLSETPICLRIQMQDADLFAIQFQPECPKANRLC